MANQKILRYGTAGAWMVVMDGDRGMPEGGFNRQILTKTSGANFETQWHDPAGFTFTQSGAPTVALDGTSALASGETWYDTATGDSYVRVANAWVKFSGGDDEARFMNTTGDTMNGQLIVNGGGGDTMELKPGTANHVYIEFFARTANPASRSGYFGFPAAGSNDFTLANSLPGDIVLAPSTGRVVLNADPTSALHAATKQYADAQAAAQAALRVAKTGDTMTGVLTMNANLNFGAGRKIDFTDELGMKIDLYGGSYGFSIESGTLRYTSGDTHAFTGSIQASSFIQSASYVRAEGGYVAADSYGYFRNYNKTGHRIWIGPWGTDASWTCMNGNCGYILLDNTGTAANMYVRANGYQNIGGANGIRFEQAIVSNFTVQGGQTATNRDAGSAWNECTTLVQKASSTANVSLAFHPGNYAPQFRVGPSAEMVYLRNSADNAYSGLSGLITNMSSIHLKQDVVSWPNTSRSLSAAATDTVDLPDALDVAMQLRPVFFRWNKEAKLYKLPLAERRLMALSRLNAFRKARDLDPFVSEETQAEPDSVTYRNWEVGEVGFIAQEVGETFPQAAHIHAESGEYEGLSAVALSAVAIAAIQKLTTRIEALEAQLAE